MEKIGIIAGTGNYPVYLLRELKKKGAEVVVLALTKEVEPALEQESDRMHQLVIGQFNRTVKIVKEENIHKLIMSGRLEHVNLYRDIRPDVRAVKFLLKLKDRRANSILRGIAEEFAKDGIELIDSVNYMTDYFVKPGLLTKKKLGNKEKSDIEFGSRIAKGVAGLDIGQTVVVKEGAVLAVEAMEGTDAAIKRAGDLGGKGAIVIKVSKPDQDLRFDLPVLGMKTIETAKEAGVKVIAFSSGMTLVLEKEEMVKECDRAGIVLYAMKDSGEKG